MAKPNKQARIAFAKARHLARQRTLQATYQWLITKQDVNVIEQQFLTEEDMQNVDVAYFSKLLKDIIKNYNILEEKLTSIIDREISELGIVEHAVLLVGLCELIYGKKIPYKVAINEAVELTKIFGSSDKSHRYINNMLDKANKTLN
jgi:N utilization substance protein B